VYLRQLLQEELKGRRRNIIVAVVISAFANAAMLGVVNTAARVSADGELSARLVLMFVAALVAYYVTMHYVYKQNTAIFELVIHKLRVRLCEKIRHSELNEFDRVDKADIYGRLTQDTIVISESQGVLTASLQASVLVLFVAFYMATLSIAAFLIMIVLALGGLSMFYVNDREIRRVWTVTARAENELLKLVTHVVEGFRQMKARRARAGALLDDVAVTSNQVRTLTAQSYGLVQSQYIFAQCFFFLMVAAVVFLAPRFIDSFANLLPELVASTLFVIGPLSLFLVGIPAFTKSELAAMRIKHLEDALNAAAGKERRAPAAAAADDQAEPAAVMALAPFTRISLRQLHYVHRSDEGAGEKLFTIGPVDISIHAGDLIYILGGNGSGKSTFLTLLAGLYRPDGGEISVDGTRVTDRHIAEYRELFTTIFAGHHLFDKLYGLGSVSVPRVDALLDQLGLAEKTQFDGKRFQNTKLSTGQLKRLALLTCILEDSPVYLFDELAADQDPGFKAYLYQQLIPEFHAAGKTIVAVTHDETYALASAGARIIRMDYGQLREVTEPPT